MCVCRILIKNYLLTYLLTYSVAESAGAVIMIRIIPLGYWCFPCRTVIRPEIFIEIRPQLFELSYSSSETKTATSHSRCRRQLRALQ